MLTLAIIVGGLSILLSPSSRSSGSRAAASWSQHFHGWQKILGVVALAALLTLLMNPEFLVVGLLGDTAFVDLLVLALSLQAQGALAQGRRHAAAVLARPLRWTWIPRPGPFYSLSWVVLCIGSALATTRGGSR